jgi:hypothetical protein
MLPACYNGNNNMESTLDDKIATSTKNDIVKLAYSNLQLFGSIFRTQSIDGSSDGNNSNEDELMHIVYNSHFADKYNTNSKRKIDESDQIISVQSYLQVNKLQDYYDLITNDVIKDELSVSDNGSSSCSSDDFSDTSDYI